MVGFSSLWYTCNASAVVLPTREESILARALTTMAFSSTSPVKPHRHILSPPKLFSYSQYAAFALSTLLVFALFMYIGSDDEMLVRAQSSFRLRQLRLAVHQGHLNSVETISPPMPVELGISASNTTEASNEGASRAPELRTDVSTTVPLPVDQIEVLVQAPETSNRVSLAQPKPRGFEVVPAPDSKHTKVALAPEDSRHTKAAAALELISEGEATRPNLQSQADPNHCDGRRIYIYELPAEFNEVIGKGCENWTVEFWNMCDDLLNNGFGRPMNLSADPVATQLLQPPSAWYQTDQFSLEVIFHHRLMTYPCLTDDPEHASLFYAPFYHALDVTRNLYNPNLALRDALAERFLTWLRGQLPWQRTRGRRHVLVLGRIVWDFLRTPSSTWGSSLLAHEELRNVTKLLIERSVWDGDTVAVPYPTNFHPASDAELTSWQARVRSANRTQLVSFAGSSRGRDMTKMVRGALFTQCARSPQCKHLVCTQQRCAENAHTVYKLALESVFCLQPAGDSPTRKGIFDTLVCGCIPVLFDPDQGVAQYLWHLKGNGSDYSVLLDGRAVTFDGYDVMAHLRRIPESEIRRLQANVVRLLPSLLYRNPVLRGEFSTKDAFDVAIDSAFDRFDVADGGGSGRLI